MSEGTIVTFYSYTGGVGRTFALANIGALLSLWGYKVLCVDWDLEAPGLHLYFKPWIQQENSPGLVELIQAYADGKTPLWQDFVTEVNLPHVKEPPLLIKAGLQDRSYIRRMQTLDWPALYNDKEIELGNKLEGLRSDWKKDFDFVLIDSRTGVSNTESICTVQFPDTLLMFLTANDQSLEGSLNVLEHIEAARNSFTLDRARLLVAPILSRFERRIEYALADEWLAKFATRLDPVYQDWMHKDITITDLLNYTRIPYIAFWSFGEKLPVIEKGTHDPEDVGFYLETLAALVAQNFAYTDILVRNRTSFVGASRKRPVAKSMGVSKPQGRSKRAKTTHLFLSYAAPDVLFCRELQKHLVLLTRYHIIDQLFVDQMPTDTSLLPETINQHLQDANIILLLISPDYLDSPSSETEMNQVVLKNNAGEAIVMPILLTPIDRETLPISKLKMLPSNGQPIGNPSNDEAWANVVSSIRRTIEDWKKA